MKHLLTTAVIFLISVAALAQKPMASTSAEFEGGMLKFQEYLRNNTVYPEKAKKKGIQGKVYVAFIILENGTIDQDSIRVIPRKELSKMMAAPDDYADVVDDKSLEAEAIRVIKSSPPWKPGTMGGHVANQMMVMPVRFR